MRPVLRLVGFFVLVLLLTSLLGHLPWIGPLFRSTGFLGILLSAALLSALLARWGERLLVARRTRGQLRALSAVESAHNLGKAGSLLLAQGRARAALGPLERAAAGEPEVAEWHYRLGLAHLRLGQLEPSRSALERCLALEEEYAYGAAQKRLVEVLQRLGLQEPSLRALDVLERNHGPSPESAYRRGLALRALGRKEEARAALAEVSGLARQATRYQRSEAASWNLRAFFTRLFC